MTNAQSQMCLISIDNLRKIIEHFIFIGDT